MEILICQDDNELKFYTSFFSFLNNNEKLLEINTEDIEIVANELCYNKMSCLRVYDIKRKCNKQINMYYKNVIEGWDCRNQIDYQEVQTILSLEEIHKNEKNNSNSKNN